MKKVLIALAVVIVLAGAGVGVYANFFRDTSSSDGRVSSDSEDAVYVDSVTSITGYGSDGALMERFAGEVEPQATLEVRLDSERKLKECYVQVGDVVREGQELFSYNTQEDEDNIAQAELEIEKAEAEIDASEQTISQYEKERQSASSDDQIEYSLEIASQENSIKQNEYNIKQKELEIEQLQDNISDAVVTAEMGGIVQKISDENDSDSSFSSSDSSSYITILAEGDYRIKGSVNELQVDQLDEDMEIIVYSRVDSSKTWRGIISEITEDKADEDSDSYYYYYNSSSDTTSYVFYVELESSEGLMLGQHVYMEEYVGQDKDRDGLWLDEYYLFWDGDDPYVWAAGSSNVIEKRAVTLGVYDEELEQYEITEGLDAEDYIAYPSDGVEAGVPVIYNDISSSDADEDYDYDDDYDDYDYDDYDFDDDDDYYYDDDDDDYYYDDDDDDDYYDDDDYDDDDEDFEYIIYDDDDEDGEDD